MSALRWLGDYWYVPFLIVIAIVGMVLLNRKSRPFSAVQKITKELGAIEAKREARNVQLQLGAEQAKQHVKEKYAEKRKVLDTKEEAKAQELEDDPVALAKFLERLTRDSSAS